MMSTCLVETECEKVRNNKTQRSAVRILFHVFSERVCSGGIFTILSIFLHEKLHFDANASTALFHVNEFIVYAFSIGGAIIADNYLGLFKTLSWMSVIFVFGAGMTTAASVDALDLPMKEMSIVGLMIAFLAAGGMKSNQCVFGGNQFKLPEQESQLNSFFSREYFAINCGLLLGQVLYPVLRSDIKCFGSDSCYTLPFAVSTCLMFLATLFLLSGKSSYMHVAVTENVFLKVCNCITYAAFQKLKRRKISLPEKSHWLDYAEDKYDSTLISDSKAVMNILKLFLTLPVFWALSSQFNSRFVFQGTKMNGDIGFYVIKPDQMAMSTSVLKMFYIPIFDYAIYPFLLKFGLKTSLQKMAMAYVMVALGFIAAGVVEWVIADNFISILWLLPQLFLISFGDMFLWVPNITFAYTQAPESMRSVMSSISYMAIAGGSVIIITVSGSNFLPSQFVEFLFYSGLMILNTLWFVLMARKYQYVDLKESFESTKL